MPRAAGGGSAGAYGAVMASTYNSRLLVPEREVARLRSKGHDVEVGANYVIPTGGAQLIRVLDSGVRACGSDPRKDGCALAQ